jgi:cyclase
VRSHARGAAVVVATSLLLTTGRDAAYAIAGALSQAVPVAAGELPIIELRSNFFMIAGAGGNVGVQVGEDGVVVVDAGAADQSAAVLAAIRRLTPKPIRYVINSGPDADHVGGNAALSKAGQTIFPDTRQQNEFLGGAASILAAEPVLRRMSEAKPALLAAGWPTETFHFARKYMFLNGEGIEILRQPAAHTDGDVFVFFRRSDVVVAGDVLDTRQFPVIDVDRGGSIQGEIAALNRLVDLAIPSEPLVSREAGTRIVPGHGRISGQLDVVEYRDMVTIIHDRVRDLAAAGKTLEQIKAAAPASGYARRYGNESGAWTTSRFIEAIHKSLTKVER